MCTPFCTVVGGPVNVPSFDLGQVWHSNGWAPITPGHTHTHTHTRISASCFLPGLMLAKSNFDLTYKCHCIKLLHMAVNPIHSIDTLTSHHPVGKYASFPPCTMTSSAIFVKTRQSPSHLAVETGMPERLQDISLMFSFQATPPTHPFFVSLHTRRFQPADGGRVVFKNRQAAYEERYASVKTGFKKIKIHYAAV